MPSIFKKEVNMRMDTAYSYMAAVFGFFIGAMLGGVDRLLTAVLIFMAIDYISGMFCAWKERKLSSRKGLIGLMKKVGMLFLICVGHVLDSMVMGNGAAFRTMVIFFFIANEGLSILENCGRMGIPIPDKLKDVIENLRE